MLNTKSRTLLKTLLPSGLVATKSWLITQGLSLHFIDNAVKNRTLVPLAVGVYVRDTIQVSWQGVIASLQRMSDIPLHVGGLTALDIAGLSHYQSRAKVALVALYSSEPLPAWLHRIELNARFSWYSTKRLWPASVMENSPFMQENQWQPSLPPMFYSTPEMAMLELLANVPDSVSFEHADQLMQGMSTLSPRRLNVLLKACRSIKIKRLFMWLAQRHNHAWLKYLTPDSYDFGSGKREIAKSGRLDRTWSITVPKEL
ncbi:hypothetical protein GKQ23_06570 [Erwinia sp. E602]|uniref:type IV toxin-antitoxin system AbiEi family antitoxin domain-containing protein n=1 Tax=Erwinia sp. E602 TaxID=2675378 RepID=UPI001BAB4A12|nr:type IV toxin-antitoxin system AbiEi family antitoxin domain-containing protein [Erwinia sp. E602]QUG74681.1 hypothetical protein GKQ23_06570 [Erwinia sp. E602]